MGTPDFNFSFLAATEANYAQAILDLVRGLALGLDTTISKPPTGAIRWSAANARWEKYNGTSWAALCSLFDMNVLRLNGYQSTDFALAGHNHAGVYQPNDAELTAIAGLTSAADKAPYFSGSGAAALMTVTSVARTLLAATTAAAQRTALGLAIGSNVQEFDATLAALAALTTAADKLIYATGSDTFSTCAFPAQARTLLAATTAALQRAALGLGTAATLDAGTAANELVQLNANGKVEESLLPELATFPPRHISGFVPAFTAFAANAAALTMAAGAAVTGPANSSVGSIMYPGGSWAVSNGNAINGYQGGTTLPANSTIHVYACSGSSGVGLFACKQDVTPVYPAGYSSAVRRVYSFITGASGEVLAKYHKDLGGGQLLTLYPQAITDVSVASHTTGVLYVLSVPIGIIVQPLFRGTVTGHTVLFTSPLFENDVACPAGASAGTKPGYSAITPTSAPVFGAEYHITDTYGRIMARCEVTGFKLYVHTRGFIDFREG